MVDHLVYGVPELEAGMDAVEELFGVRPAPGGRHPHLGSHNALLSLGPTTYLEVVAPDPSLSRPDEGTVFGLDKVTESGLVTWALRREDIEEGAKAAAATGTDLGPVLEGARDRTDGVRLTWKLTDPYAMPMNGLVPFLIAWGDTPHPAGAAPMAGRLAGITIRHPHPEGLKSVLSALHVEVEIVAGSVPGLWARIRTRAGVVELSPAKGVIP